MRPCRTIPLNGLAAVILAALLAGCASPGTGPGGAPIVYPTTKTIKPLLAVTDFENRSNFNGAWNLGGGMAELLIDELLATEKVTVLERQHIGDVLNEIGRQGGGLFRKEGRVKRGRLKNAKFLVRGVVTDFTVTDEASGWFGIKSFRAKGAHERARVAVSIQVSDVENGEIIASVKTSGKVSAGGFGLAYNYKDIAFGGDTFFRTPLGKATESAIDKAVKKIIKSLPRQYWQPQVAESGPDYVIVNGGLNVKIKKGDRFLVRDRGRTVTDPHTGDVLETMPGQVLGKIEVQVVRPTTAYAILLEGLAERGQMLEPVQNDE